MWLEGMKLQMPSLLVGEREVQNTDITKSQREKISALDAAKLFYFTTD